MTPYQMFRLDLACKPIVEAFQATPYLVGSVTTSDRPRDVDVRLILPDEQYDRIIDSPEMRTMLSLAFTAYLVAATDLPIDFGIQRQTEANEQHPGSRNPLGLRGLSAWTGDAPPSSRSEG